MEILDQFEKYLKNKNPNISDVTIKMYKESINKYFNFAEDKYKEKKRYIYSISKRKFKLYKSYMKKRGYSINTINMQIRFFSIYEDFLIEINRKEYKVFNKNLYYKPERRNIENISRETYEELIEIAKKDSSKYYLMFLLYVKCRISSRNLMRIRIKDDINLKNRTIKINDKVIEINNEIERAIRKYLKDRKKFLEGYKNEYLFVSHIGKKYGKPMEKSSLSRAVKKYYQKFIQMNEYYEGYWGDQY